MTDPEEQFKARYVAAIAEQAAAAQRPSLAAALAAVQAELPDLAKTKTAKVRGQTKDGRMFEYEYKYADLADVSKAVMPLMGKHGLAFTCQPGERDDGRLGVAYQLLHSSGEHIDGWFPVKNDLKMQDIGGSITYIRRYALCSLIGVAAEEDTDAQGIDAAKPDRKPRSAPPQRASGNLPRNADGSTSRSRTTDTELAATGQMTDTQMRDHNKLERDVKGKGPQGTERATSTDPDDPFYSDPPQPVLRAPQAAPNTAGVIHAYFKRFGYTDSPDDRAARLRRISVIAGRTVASVSDLTAAEGLTVKTFLSKCKDAAALDEALALETGEPTDA